MTLAIKYHQVKSTYYLYINEESYNVLLQPGMFEFKIKCLHGMHNYLNPERHEYYQSKLFHSAMHSLLSHSYKLVNFFKFEKNFNVDYLCCDKLNNFY